MMKDGEVIGPCGPTHRLDYTVPRAGVPGDAAARAGLRVELDGPAAAFPFPPAQRLGGERRRNDGHSPPGSRWSQGQLPLWLFREFAYRPAVPKAFVRSTLSPRTMALVLTLAK